MLSTSANAFEFPREYFFPPFFTRQTNLTTYHAQLTKWAALVLAYCRHHGILKLSVSGSCPSSSSSPPPSGELFHNASLGRKLSAADAREVIEFLRRDGRAEWIGGDGKDAGNVAWIYWRTPDEWAALVEAWVDGTAQKGSVLTLYELTQGESTAGTEFHGLDPELLQKALGILVKRGKAQIFGQEDSLGIKFF